MSMGISFDTLTGVIRQAHEELAARAGRAINLSLTLRNWLIGCYIAEYELRGSDRAQYGDNLLSELAKHLTELKVSNCNRRQLYRYLRFYRLYPEIVGTLSAQLKKLLPAGTTALEKVGTASPQLRPQADTRDGGMLSLMSTLDSPRLKDEREAESVADHLVTQALLGAAGPRVRWSVAPCVRDRFLAGTVAGDQPGEQVPWPAPDLVTDQPRPHSGNLVTPRLTKLAEHRQRTLPLCEVARMGGRSGGRGVRVASHFLPAQASGRAHSRRTAQDGASGRPKPAETGLRCDGSGTRASVFRGV